eukprot:CAMPEP_0171893250 /NCGR_PEP_ID=MMETSP0992-20121227/45771_1 /TAXON_ID=483369 /ORGANISM="non described non described, Strain CCMP2098" /LENGTH=59 /DNA_ID=CAMNT_0012520837 /DNA_START=524 /DNA_END=703 /DNA_ORIENTATION=-
MPLRASAMEVVTSGSPAARLVVPSTGSTIQHHSFKASPDSIAAAASAAPGGTSSSPKKK